MLKKFFKRPPDLKSTREIGLMREAGKLVAQALKLCEEMAVPGRKTIEIDQAVEELYRDHGATPLFKGYKGKVPFPAVTCISLNEEVVHGIPSAKREIKEGDLVKIDTACKLNGWCGDRAITLMIGEVSEERRRLVNVAKETLEIAMKQMSRWKKWTQVAEEMQNKVESNGLSVVTQYVGHGIGKIMHEEPQVPNFVNREVKKHDFELQVGLVLAVEPMVNMGTAETKTLRDHWTVVTRDNLPSAHVEHTLAIVKEGVYVLTAEEELIIPREE